MMTKNIELYKTGRGFLRADFEDLYGSQCSIQESSLATDNAIWFGVDIPSKEYSEKESVRMHLNQKQVKQLLTMLEHFVETGYLE